VSSSQRVPQLTIDHGLRADRLRDGTIEVVGRLVEASNMTLYCDLGDGDHCVYKPVRGERPLDDFPGGTLAFREVAAFEVSEAAGWRIVPPTVLRDGPLGPGMVQWWVDVDPEANILEMILTRDQRLRPMALFDAVVNNADRKGGHLLPTDDGHLYGCDHGVCFAIDPKLRSVLWGWRGEKLTAQERACLRDVRALLRGPLRQRLSELLSPEEVDATDHRVADLLQSDRLPLPAAYRPAIPWPPF